MFKYLFGRTAGSVEGRRSQSKADRPSQRAARRGNKNRKESLAAGFFGQWICVVPICSSPNTTISTAIPLSAPTVSAAGAATSSSHTSKLSAPGCSVPELSKGENFPPPFLPNLGTFHRNQTRIVGVEEATQWVEVTNNKMKNGIAIQGIYLFFDDSWKGSCKTS